MSVVNTEKKFVIKHTFEDIDHIPSIKSTEANNYGCNWTLFLKWTGNMFLIILEVEQMDPASDWSIDTTINLKTFKNQSTNHKFLTKTRFIEVQRISLIEYRKLPTIDGKRNLYVECHVTINKRTGFEKEKLRNFNDESAEKFSDVVLIVGGEKFYVLKKFLASHSSYFESLFSGNFAESEQSEIELKDIDPVDFQNFLELINGDSFVDDGTVEGILNLADFFDSKTAIRRCDEFLLNRSKLSLKSKFNLAIKCQLDELKKKCLSEMKSKEDVESVIPEDPFEINQDVWAELFKKVASFK